MSTLSGTSTEPSRVSSVLTDSSVCPLWPLVLCSALLCCWADYPGRAEAGAGRRRCGFHDQDVAHARLLHAAIPGAGAAELATSSSDRAVTSGCMLLGRRSGWAGALFCSKSVGGCDKPKTSPLLSEHSGTSTCAHYGVREKADWSCSTGAKGRKAGGQAVPCSYGKDTFSLLWWRCPWLALW